MPNDSPKNSATFRQEPSLGAIQFLKTHAINLTLLQLLVALKRPQYLAELVSLSSGIFHRRTVEKIIKRRPDLIEKGFLESSDAGPYRKFVTLQRTPLANEILSKAFGVSEPELNKSLPGLNLPPKPLPVGYRMVRFKENFLALLAKEGYELLGHYAKSKDKVQVRCPRGRVFYLYPGNFLRGARCSCCRDFARKRLKKETELYPS